MRYAALVVSIVGMLVFAGFASFHSMSIVGVSAGWIAAAFAALTALGVYDLLQRHHALKRNYPILANIRFVLEKVRPEIRQYFLESDLDGTPFNRTKRAVVYQRAKKALETRPFGTEKDVYATGYEWLAHSLAPARVVDHDFRVRVGGPDCEHPYDISLFNISAMSFGSLSANAIRALNKGAKIGGFAHDTGEGGFSAYHREFGGDIIWEIGSGYFGCRKPAETPQTVVTAADERQIEQPRRREYQFCEEKFTALAASPQIKMIEIKLSQGAKPGHGGVLPGKKVTPEIAAARDVEVGVDCVSPAAHSAFSTPLEMMAFITKLRKLSGGKPVGFKLCVGHKTEFMALCKAMVESGVAPDFIVIDGKEGGTGAAPLEFTDHIGYPLREGLTFAHNCLVGAGLRGRVKLGASGRVVTAFDIARTLSLGADWCNAARGFMFAVGCVQSQSCHTDRCPTGVATQNKWRQRAIVVPDKAQRVANFHAGTLHALGELIAAAGVTHPAQVGRERVMRRASSTKVESFAEVYPQIEAGCLLNGRADAEYAALWEQADPASFQPKPRVKAAA